MNAILFQNFKFQTFRSQHTSPAFHVVCLLISAESANDEMSNRIHRLSNSNGEPFRPRHCSNVWKNGATKQRERE